MLVILKDGEKLDKDGYIRKILAKVVPGLLQRGLTFLQDRGSEPPRSDSVPDSKERAHGSKLPRTLTGHECYPNFVGHFLSGRFH
jgi:hypothetical protein